MVISFGTSTSSGSRYRTVENSMMLMTRIWTPYLELVGADMGYAEIRDEGRFNGLNREDASSQRERDCPPALEACARTFSRGALSGHAAVVVWLSRPQLRVSYLAICGVLARAGTSSRC